MKEENGQRQKILINKKKRCDRQSLKVTLEADAAVKVLAALQSSGMQFPTASWELRTGHTPVAGAHLAFMGTRHVVPIHASKILIHMIENEKNVK